MQMRLNIAVLIGLLACVGLLSGCAAKPSPTSEEYDQMSPDEESRALKAELKRSIEVMEERRRNPPKKEVPLPNYRTGANNPKPLGTNFYVIAAYHPGYLLCTYDVDEIRYDEAKEPQRFEIALSQIRAKSRDLFPPVKWIAVIIVNSAEHTGVETFEASHKAGAIFLASEVFDINHDLGKSIAQAQIDRHPFRYDKQQPTPGEQQRWTIVERHESTNPKTPEAPLLKTD